MFWLWLAVWEPGEVFWDLVAGLGFFAAIGGLLTLSPGLFLAGVALLFAAWRWGG